MVVDEKVCKGCYYDCGEFKREHEWPCKDCVDEDFLGPSLWTRKKYKAQEIAEERVEAEAERWTDNEKVHPDHYNNSKITPFDVWDDWNLDPYTATAIKYIKRAGSKAGESEKDDLEKAIDYLKERVKRL